MRSRSAGRSRVPRSYDYGTSLYIEGVSKSFAAGRYVPQNNELDCLGLIVSKFTATEVDLKIGAPLAGRESARARGQRDAASRRDPAPDAVALAANEPRMAEPADNPAMVEWAFEADDLYAGVTVVDLATPAFRIALSADFATYTPVTEHEQLISL